VSKAPTKSQTTETRPLWKDYERAVRDTFGWIKATRWKPNVPIGSQVPKS